MKQSILLLIRPLSKNLRELFNARGLRCQTRGCCCCMTMPDHIQLMRQWITIANVFNTYFSSAARKLIEKLPENNHLAHKDPLINLNSNFKTPISSLRFNYTTTHEVNSVIYSLKTKDSYGYDEISSRILKSSAPYETASVV